MSVYSSNSTQSWNVMYICIRFHCNATFVIGTMVVNSVSIKISIQKEAAVMFALKIHSVWQRAQTILLH